MKVIYKFLFYFNILIGLVTLLSYISPFVHPGQLWPITVLGLLYPLWLFCNIVFVLFWLLSKHYKRSVFSIVVIFIGWSYLTSFINFKSPTASLEDKRLDIISFNLQGLQMITKNSDQSTKDSLHNELKHLLSKDKLPDIVCVQDMVSKNISFFKEELGLTHLHKLSKQRTTTGIFSRFPIKDKGRIDFSNSFNSCIWADVDWGGTTIRVYSMHLESNRITDDAEKMMVDGLSTNEGSRKKVRTMFAKYKNSAVTRTEQAKLINQHIRKSPYPVILSGDLNDTPLSHIYRTVSESLVDGFRVSGRGIGTTYAGGIPGLRIDYIFADQSFEVLQYNTLKEGVYSDHYPIRSQLILR